MEGKASVTGGHGISKWTVRQMEGLQYLQCGDGYSYGARVAGRPGEAPVEGFMFNKVVLSSG